MRCWSRPAMLRSNRRGWPGWILKRARPRCSLATAPRPPLVAVPIVRNARTGERCALRSPTSNASSRSSTLSARSMSAQAGRRRAYFQPMSSRASATALRLPSASFAGSPRNTGPDRGRASRGEPGARAAATLAPCRRVHRRTGCAGVLDGALGEGSHAAGAWLAPRSSCAATSCAYSCAAAASRSSAAS